MTEEQEKFETNLKKLKKANARLAEAIRMKPDNQIIKDGTIQRFEFTVELAWKTLQSYLRDKKKLIVKSPGDALDLAFENGLIDDIKEWGQILTARNQTSHIYDEATADDIYKLVKAKKHFIDKLILRFKTS